MPDTDTLPPFDAYAGTEPYVFVSYSHADSRQMFGDIARLHKEGYRIWFDEGIDPGNEWPEEVARALANAAAFMVFISPASVVSRNVRNEINFALNNEKPFIAVHLEETTLPSGLALRMGDIQAILRHRMAADSYWRKLLRALPSEIHCPVSVAQSKPQVDILPGTPSVRKRRIPSLSQRTILGGAKLKGWAFSPCRSEIVAADAQGLIHVISTNTSNDRVLHTTDREIHRIYLHPSGDIAAILESDELQPQTQDPAVIRICDSQNSYELRHPEGSSELLFSRDGRWLASGGSVRADSKQTTMIWRLEPTSNSTLPSAVPSHTIKNPNIESFAFDGEGTVLATGDAAGWVQLWQLDNQLECLRMYHADEVLSVQFSPDGSLLLTASKDKTAKLWDANGGELVATFQHSDMLSKAAISGDGLYVATAGHDGAWLWDLSGRALSRLAHDSNAPGVLDVQFAPGSNFLVTGGCDDTARVWSSPGGQELARLYHSQYAGEIYPVRVSADGAVIGTCGSYGPLFLWDYSSSAKK